MRFHKKFVILISSLLMISLMIGLSQNTLAHSPDKIPQNQWIQKGSQKYLEISAKNYYELGTLEGTFLGEQILYLDSLLEQLVASYGYDMDDFLAYCYIYEQQIWFRQFYQDPSQCRTLSAVDLPLKQVKPQMTF